MKPEMLAVVVGLFSFHFSFQKKKKERKYYMWYMFTYLISPSGNLLSLTQQYWISEDFVNNIEKYTNEIISIYCK